MAFGTNYDNIPQGGNELIPEGFYECIITNAEIRQTQNGKYKVGFMLTIRNDIQQPCVNRVHYMSFIICKIIISINNSDCIKQF